MSGFHLKTGSKAVLVGCVALLAAVVATAWAGGGPGAKMAAPSSGMRVYALRLKPGQDLKQELLAFTRREKLQAVTVLTCVGSLTDTALRYANKEGTTRAQGHFEIVSLVGLIDPNGSHLHLSVSDGEGRTVGGHLMDGNKVYTTAEIVLGELTELQFTRERDETFGYNELVVRKRPEKP